MAAQRCGFTTVGFCEIDSYAQKVLAKHWPGVPIIPDIHDLTAEVVLRILHSCDGNALTVKSDQLSGTENHTARNATQNVLRNGGKKILSGIESTDEIIAKESEGKSLLTTAVNVPAAENANTNFLPLTTSSTMEIRKEKNTNPKRGSSPSNAAYPMTTPFSATTATKPEHISEYARTRRIDLITAGFPCQPFSCAGKRRGADDHRALWPEIARLLREMDAIGIKPAWCLFENVAGIIGMELDGVLSDLENIGYACWPIVIPACAVDAKHRRDRVWIVGYAKCQFRKQSGNGGRRQEMDRKILEKSERLQNADAIKGPGKDVANSNKQGLSRTAWAGFGGVLRSPGQSEGRESGRGIAASWCQWPVEPAVGRVAHGVSNRVDRLKGLGNAIVPQVAEQILKHLTMPPASWPK